MDLTFHCVFQCLILDLIALWDFPEFISNFLKTVPEHSFINVNSNSECLVSLSHKVLKLDFYNVGIKNMAIE